MKEPSTHVYNVNRVEGDLKIRVELEDNTVTDARCTGTMYRGFENIMIGRGALDGIVITPRICGICSTSHLNAAAKALDMLYGVQVPDNAKRVRNATLMTEHIQNDVRHAFLLFMADSVNKAYQGQPFYEEAVERYAPLKGSTVIQTVAESKKLLEIIAILGGQWPHSSFMVPGGVVSVPSRSDIAQCRYLLQRFRRWYERRILGCSLEEWSDVKSVSDLDAWLERDEGHRESDLGFVVRFSRAVGLDRIGAGHGNFISFGSFDMPVETGVSSLSDGGTFCPSGFVSGGDRHDFAQEKVTEDVSHSWFTGGKGMHPFANVTVPYATGDEGHKYSWAKAPRYEGKPSETGPLAEMIVASRPFFTELVRGDGATVFARVLARLLRPTVLLPAMDMWLEEIVKSREPFYAAHERVESGEGFGTIEAPRGALGHWLIVNESKIEKYQIITPTAWNVSPRCSQEHRGPMEEALTGLTISQPNNPVEVDHVIRSFDPCLVCTVHVVDCRQRNSS